VWASTSSTALSNPAVDTLGMLQTLNTLAGEAAVSRTLPVKRAERR
jgi:hypothetical protein